MKKILLLAVVFVLSAFVLSSCTEKNSKSNSDLSNTTWANQFEGPGGKPYNVELNLKSGNKFKLDIIITHDASFSETLNVQGDYSYNSPNITFTFDDEGDIEIITGKVSGNKMTLYGESIFFDEGEEIVLKKK